MCTVYYNVYQFCGHKELFTEEKCVYTKSGRQCRGKRNHDLKQSKYCTACQHRRDLEARSSKLTPSAKRLPSSAQAPAPAYAPAPAPGLSYMPSAQGLSSVRSQANFASVVQPTSSSRHPPPAPSAAHNARTLNSYTSQMLPRGVAAEYTAKTVRAQQSRSWLNTDQPPMDEFLSSVFVQGRGNDSAPYGGGFASVAGGGGAGGAGGGRASGSGLGSSGKKSTWRLK
ncbi:uncharacterized protein V1518DRAFT_405429 [Limtongia smithiae]|uniref:uncharacterized protein n=1 Tax=Limtongia smithiae TaxID=1125753 RepID=UPI0034CE7024